jgi:heavy metal sensor kinase
MIRLRDVRRLSRGLRFRLTAIYAVIFAILLVSVTTLLRARLAAALDTQAQAVLDQEWAAMKGYLRIEPPPAIKTNWAYWYYDPHDPDEARIVLNIKRIHQIADRNGQIIPEYVPDGPPVPARSSAYASLFDPPAAIQSKVKQALALKPGADPAAYWVKRHAQGEEYLIRSGIVYDQEHLMPGRGLPYYVSIGSSLRQYNNILRQFTWIYAGIIPGSLLLGSLLGWFMSGRALTPVRDVALAAQRISASNLSLRIPARQAGDELDYLILTFNRMIDRIETSFQQIKQFSTDVSHELRTPITAIRGQLEVALFTAQTTEQYREAMFNALQDIDRLSQIVRALLLLSQAESGQLALQKSRLDLAEAARDLVEQFQIPAEGASLTLTSEIPPSCPADVDRVQIERLITNLLSNAIKFTPEGGRVTLRLRRVPAEPGAGQPPHREYIELVVEDTGRGIAAEHLPHIFDRFYRVSGPGGAPAADQGLGLGLSFVAWIAKAHHGRVDVESSPGKGARFIVRLPAPGVGSETAEFARPDTNT